MKLESGQKHGSVLAKRLRACILFQHVTILEPLYFNGSGVFPEPRRIKSIRGNIITLTGVRHIFNMLEISLLSSTGFNPFNAILCMCGFSSAGVCLAISLKAKKKEIRAISPSATASALLGIADKAGVSRVTVSRVLSNHPSVKAEARKKVLYRVKALDYEPNLIAQSLAGNRTSIIGLLYAGGPLFPSPQPPRRRKSLSAIEKPAER